jgi:hypothetical protein
LAWIRGLALAACSACAAGTATTTGGPSTLGSGGEDDGASTGATSSGSAGETTGSDTAADLGSADSTGSSGTDGTAASCVDGLHNGDESDVDCGGSCPPCTNGLGCLDAADCASRLCDGGLCCTATTYEKSTGLVSGSATVCCDGDDARLEFAKCGDGMNYTCGPEGDNCARTDEGAMNNGSACVTITCEKLDCAAP